MKYRLLLLPALLAVLMPLAAWSTPTKAKTPDPACGCTDCIWYPAYENGKRVWRKSAISPNCPPLCLCSPPAQPPQDDVSCEATECLPAVLATADQKARLAAYQERMRKEQAAVPQQMPSVRE